MILQRKIGGGSFADVVAFAEYAGSISGVLPVVLKKYILH